jgi:dienelactone hydrolase
MFAAGYRVGPDTYSDLLRSWAAAGFVVAAPEFPLEDQAVAGAALDEGDLTNEPADVAFVMAALLRPADPVASRIAADQVAVTGHSDGAEVALAVAQEGLSAVKAAIIMSGQPVTPKQSPNPPLLVIQGNQDTINPPSLSQAVYDTATPPRYFLTLIGAGHLPPYVPGTAWEPIVKAVTLDFLSLYLARRTATDAAMRADANRPGLAALS